MAPLSSLLTRTAQAANTEYDVVNTKTDLTSPSTYSTGGTAGTGVGGTTPAPGVPTVTSDVTFDSGVAYAPAAFTLVASEAFGSLNDLSTTAVAISNSTGTAATTLTLGGSGDLGDSVPGSASGDLLFVGTGAALTLTAGTGITALNVALGQSGNFNIVGTATVSSTISGAFGITKTGTGQLVLSGSNSFSGGLTVSAGSVSLSNANALASTSAVTLGSASGVSELYGNAGSVVTFATLSLVNNTTNALLYANSGSITVTGAVSLGGANVSNLLVENTNSNGGNLISLAGPVSGSGTITIDNTSGGPTVLSDSTANSINNAGGIVNVSTGTGAGTISGSLGSSVTNVIENSKTSNLYLSGTNAATGPVFTALAGMLEFQQRVSLYDGSTTSWTASNIIAQQGAIIAFEVGNTGGFTQADLASLNTVASGNGGFETGSLFGIDTTGASLTYTTGNSGVITNAGSNITGLAKIGTNSLILEAAQTYTGETLISGGTLQLGTNTAGQNASLASTNIVDNAGLLFEPAASTSETFSGGIAGTGAVTLNGGGSAILSGANIYTGATLVTAGVLDLQNSYALQNSAGSFGNAGLTFDSSVTSKTFQIGALTANANNNISLQNTAVAAITLTVGSLNNYATNSSTTGTYSGLGGLTYSGVNGTFQLASASTYAGTTTILGGTFNLSGSIIAAGSSPASAGPLVIGGGGGTLSLTKSGSPTQTFAGTTINYGENFITTAASSGETLNLGAITTNVGGTWDANPASATSITTTTGNTNGIIGGFATEGGKAAWAVGASTPGTVTAITAFTPAAGSNTTSLGATAASYNALVGSAANIDVTASQAITGGAITVNSLRFNTNAAETLTLTGTNTIASGGILLTPTDTNEGTFTGGQLTVGSSNQLDINIGGTGSIDLVSQIVDNGSPVAVAVSAPSTASAGVSFNNTNNSFSGGLYLNGAGSVKYANGTPFGTGTVTVGSQLAGNVAYGALSVGSGAIITSGLLADAAGYNSDNGQLDGYSGGIWTLIGATGASATYNGSIGTSAAGRETEFAVDGGTQIFGALGLVGSFNGVGSFAVNGGTLQMGNGNSGVLTNETTVVYLGGGNFVEAGNVAGPYSQTYSGLQVNSGASKMFVYSNGGAGTAVNVGTFGRSTGGTVDFTLPTALGGSQGLVNGIITTQTNTNGILGGYATVGGTDWASVNATGNIVGLTANGGYGADNFSGVNTDVTTNDSPATGSTNSVRFNAAGADTVTYSGLNSITSGGILVTPNVGVNVNPSTITGGILQGSASNELIVIQNNLGAGLTIASNINNAVTTLTKSGAGLLTLTGSNTLGALYLNGGVLNTGGVGTAAITFNGGDLQAAVAISTSDAVTVGINGGTIDTSSGNVTLSGNVTKDGGSEFVGAGAYGGFVNTGVGALTKVGTGQLTLSGTANTFGGGLIIKNGTVQDAATSGTGALGSGYITFGASNSPIVDMDGHSATVAGLIGSGTNGVITNNGGTTSTLTLDGVVNETYAGILQNGTSALALTVALNSPLEVQTLTGANTYSGTTTVTSGELAVAGSGLLGGGTAPLTMGGGLLDLGGTTQTVGAVSISAASASGNTIQNGTLSVASTYAASNTTGNAIVSANLYGTAGLTKSGAGQLTLSGANNYSGVTTATAGVLEFVNETSLYGDNAPAWTGTNLVVSSGATLQLGVGGAGQFTSTDVTALQGIIGNNSSATNGFKTGSILGFDTTNGSFNYNGTIANAYSGATLGVTANGGNTLQFSGVNYYTGGTTVAAGTTLDDSNPLALQNTAVSLTGTGTLVFDSSVSSHSFAVANLPAVNFALTDNGSNAINLTFSPNAVTDTYNNVLSGGGSIAMSGNAATLSLGGANTFSGTTNINSGTVLLNFAATGAPTSNILYNGVTANTLVLGGVGIAAMNTTNSGAALNVTGAASVANSQTFGGLTLNPGNSIITTVDGTSGSVELKLGAITHNAGGAVDFIPGGTYVSGTNAINATGTSNDPNGGGILGGWALYNKTGYATINGSSDIAAYTYTTTTTPTGGTIVDDAGTPANGNVDLTGSGAAGNVALSGTSNGATNINTLTQSTITASTIAVTGTLRLGANGGILQGSSGALTIGASAGSGILTAGGSAYGTGTGGQGEITIADVAGSNNVTVNSVIANNNASTGTANSTGAGTVTLTIDANSVGATTLVSINGANSYSGGTYLVGSRVNAGSATAFGTGQVTVLPGAQIFDNGFTIANNLNIAGIGQNENTGYLSTFRFLGTGGTASGNINLLADAAIMTQGSTGYFTGNFSGTGALDTFAGGGGTDGLVIGSTTSSVSTTDTITGNFAINGFSPGTPYVLNSNITIKIGGNNALPSANQSASSVGNVIINGGATTNATKDTLDLNGYSPSINGLVSTGPDVASAYVTNSGAANVTLSLGYNNATAVFGGVVADGGAGKTLSIAKYGTGTQFFTGSSTYIGSTTVNAGTMTVTGDLAGTSGVTVNTGGNLHLLSSTAQVAGGGSVSMLNALAPISISGSGVQISLDLAGNVQPTNTFSIGGVAQSFGVYGSLAFFNLNPSEVSSAGTNYVTDESYFSGDGGISTAAPEPGSLGLLGVAGLMMMRRRRKSVTKA